MNRFFICVALFFSSISLATSALKGELEWVIAFAAFLVSASILFISGDDSK